LPACDRALDGAPEVLRGSQGLERHDDPDRPRVHREQPRLRGEAARASREQGLHRQGLAPAPTLLTKRIIPCLDVRDGRVVKGVNFGARVEKGDPAEHARRYDEEGADEIALLDITATTEGRRTMLDVVARTAAVTFTPLTVGGGIATEADVEALLEAGADK